MRLAGRSALITGSGRNTGRAIALAMADEGANIVVNGVADRAAADEVVAQVERRGVRAIAVMADIGDPAQVDELARRALEAFGTVDILVNNASVHFDLKPFLEVTDEELQAVTAVNFHAGARLVRALAPGMIAQGWGRILQNVGGMSYTGQPMRAHISAAKTANIGLTRSLAKEFAPHGVLVNCVCPGRIDTTADGDEEATGGRSSANIPVGRLGRPNDIAALSVFLASDDASFITGQVIAANGGEICL